MRNGCKSGPSFSKANRFKWKEDIGTRSPGPQAYSTVSHYSAFSPTLVAATRPPDVRAEAEAKVRDKRREEWHVNDSGLLVSMDDQRSLIRMM